MGAGIFHRLRYLRGLCHDLRADLPCHRADGDRKRDPGRYAAERLVRTESSYFSNQGELASYREMGIQEYTFLGGGCEICMELNGQSFPLDEAEPGLNLPPIHPNCKCTIKAKAKIDLFKDREGVNPLESNPKYEEWKKKYVDTPAPEPIIKLSENEKHAINSYKQRGIHVE